MNMFITDMKFIFESTSTFTAVSLALLLIATCYIAKKCPAKLHAIGMITIIWGLLCLSVSLVAVFDDYMCAFGDNHSRLVDLINSGVGIKQQDIETNFIWQEMLPSLRNSCTILFWSTIVYLISRILYIIRTPRI